MLSAFREEENVRDSFFQGQVEPPATDRDIRYIDWTTGTQPAGTEHVYLQEQNLVSDPQLRVIFAPLDLPGNGVLRPLFDRYKIPAAFISERLHNVVYGSGSQTSSDGFHLSWFHYLCKSIDVARNPDSDTHSLRIVDRHTLNKTPINQSNWTWLRSAFFLRWAPHTPQQNAHQQVPAGGSVTLICFGGSQSLLKRFRGLIDNPEWQTTLKDPYSLFVIAFGEIFIEMDEQAWNLGDVFRDIENTTLQKAAKMNTNSTRYDFVGLYNIAKHCTYLREGFDAALETLADIRSQHQSQQLIIQSEEKDVTESMLTHQKGLFKSTNLRLASLHSRIQSIITLSFNLVTQQDSRVMWQDNQTMKAIALITLLFLPMATVATFFGCQFFGLDSSTSPPTFRVSPQIWIFAVTFAVVMVLMIPMWRMVQLGAGRLTKAPQEVSKDSTENKTIGRWRLWMTPSVRNGDEAIELTSSA